MQLYDKNTKYIYDILQLSQQPHQSSLPFLNVLFISFSFHQASHWTECKYNCIRNINNIRYYQTICPKRGIFAMKNRTLTLAYTHFDTTTPHSHPIHLVYHKHTNRRARIHCVRVCVSTSLELQVYPRYDLLYVSAKNARRIADCVGVRCLMCVARFVIRWRTPSAEDKHTRVR